jgi:hypothetical protein
MHVKSSYAFYKLIVTFIVIVKLDDQQRAANSKRQYVDNKERIYVNYHHTLKRN